ncbi:MAG TPA: hypothetical protein VGM94_15090 [Galbitalea sp.]
MEHALSPLSVLIEERRLRVDQLLKFLDGSEQRWIRMEAVYFGVIKADPTCYKARTWDLFQSDLDLLEENQHVTVRDDDYVALTKHAARTA